MSEATSGPQCEATVRWDPNLQKYIVTPGELRANPGGVVRWCLENGGGARIVNLEKYGDAFTDHHPTGNGNYIATGHQPTGGGGQDYWLWVERDEERFVVSGDGPTAASGSDTLSVARSIRAELTSLSVAPDPPPRVIIQ